LWVGEREEREERERGERREKGERSKAPNTKVFWLLAVAESI